MSYGIIGLGIFLIALSIPVLDMAQRAHIPLTPPTSSLYERIWLLCALLLVVVAISLFVWGLWREHKREHDADIRASNEFNIKKEQHAIEMEKHRAWQYQQEKISIITPDKHKDIGS
jgi:hypothetical protein